MRTSFFLPVFLLVTSFGPTLAGQDAAPSSHLVGEGGFEGDILINEVRVPKEGEALHTYYEALGWSGKAGGYAGIQAHPKARNYIFSIWDHKEHTGPITAVYRGPGTLTENFGGEGTGLKSWNFELGWETDVWYTLVARCWPEGEHTFYGYWVRSGRTGEWTHMVTMDVAAKDAYLQGGNDSFLEDWLETGKNPRTTNLRNAWKRKPNGEWHAFETCTYSVNSWDLTEGKRSFNYRTNWNGGVAEDADGAYFFMTAGGAETKPTVENPSKHTIENKATKPAYGPLSITAASMTAAPDGGALTVVWETDPKTLPPFRYRIEVYDNALGKGEPVLRAEKSEPHARRAELSLPAELKGKRLYPRLRCEDILGNLSESVSVR